MTFSTTWVPSHHRSPSRWSTIAASTRPSRPARGAGPRGAPTTAPTATTWSRSLLTLRLLTHDGTGGIVAAPTTSLPEDFGGERNWDYRYCWLRDAALTLEALLAVGLRRRGAAVARLAAARRRRRPRRTCRSCTPSTAAGDLPERTLDHLPGYAGSRPVADRQRRGRAAPDRRARRGDDRPRDRPRRRRQETTDAWALQRALVEELAEHWDEPDNGLWEIRGPLRHFTHSRVMVWVAFDRAVARGRGARPRRAGRPVAGAARRRCATRSSSKGYDPSAAPSPSTTTPPRSTPPCWCSPTSASSPATTRGCSAPSRPSRRT